MSSTEKRTDEPSSAQIVEVGDWLLEAAHEHHEASGRAPDHPCDETCRNLEDARTMLGKEYMRLGTVENFAAARVEVTQLQARIESVEDLADKWIDESDLPALDAQCGRMILAALAEPLGSTEDPSS